MFAVAHLLHVDDNNGEMSTSDSESPAHSIILFTSLHGHVPSGECESLLYMVSYIMSYIVLYIVSISYIVVYCVVYCVCRIVYFILYHVSCRTAYIALDPVMLFYIIEFGVVSLVSFSQTVLYHLVLYCF